MNIEPNISRADFAVWKAELKDKLRRSGKQEVDDSRIIGNDKVHVEIRAKARRQFHRNVSQVMLFLHGAKAGVNAICLHLKQHGLLRDE